MNFKISPPGSNNETLITLYDDDHEVGHVIVDPNNSEILEVFVEKMDRKEGYGELLMQAGEKYISEHSNENYITLNPWSKHDERDERGLPSDSLIRWYQKQGYDWNEEDKDEFLNKEVEDIYSLIKTIKGLRY